MKHVFFRLAASFSLIFILCGCASTIQKDRRPDSEKIKDLSQKVDELSRARSILEDRLAKEISDKTVKLDMMEKGLVVTFVADILFDSGKAKLRPEADASLDKVSRVIVENLPDRPIGIEGHTDNEPIQASGWRSNWELSVARALSVLHYLQDEKNVDPKRLCVTGYGQERPVADNSARDGRQMNRRVEIVIMPKLSRSNDTGGPGSEIHKGLK